MSGTIIYRERIALPPQAVVEVRLLDVSVADGASQTIAMAAVGPEGQVTIRYELRFGGSRIVCGRAYAVQALIMVDDRMWFASMVRHGVFTGGRDSADILVQCVAATSEGASGPGGAQG